MSWYIARIFLISSLDADEIINMKMSQNEAKYPVDKAKEAQQSTINYKMREKMAESQYLS